jgi:hypothetical protein
MRSKSREVSPGPFRFYAKPSYVIQGFIQCTFPLFWASSEDLVFTVPRSLPRANTIGKVNAIAIVYSFARIFRAMSCNAMRIKLLRRRAGLTITPWFQCRGLILVFVLFTPKVGFPPQMTLVFISGTRRSLLEQKHPTAGCTQSIL